MPPPPSPGGVRPCVGCAEGPRCRVPAWDAVLGCIAGEGLGELLESPGTITHGQGDRDKSPLCARHEPTAATLSTWGSARLGFC